MDEATAVNIGLVLGTWALVLATIYYSRATLRTTQREADLKLKEIQRPIIKELLAAAILPLMDKLERSNNAIETKNLGWSHKQHRFSFLQEIEMPTVPLSGEFSWIADMIKSYNSSIVGLADSLGQIGDDILTPEFEKKCHSLVASFNTEAQEKYKVPASEIEVAPARLLSYIIDNRSKLDNEDSYCHFWEKFGPQLLKIRREGQVKPIFDLFDNVVSIAQISFSVNHKILYTTFEKLRVEYGLSIDELRKLSAESSSF